MRKGTMLTRTSFLERRRRLAKAAALRRQREAAIRRAQARR